MKLTECLFYEEPGITIYCGDARAIVPLLCPGTSYCLEACSGLCGAVIVTDPPYGIRHPVNYGTRGRAKAAAYSDWTTSRSLRNHGLRTPARDYPMIAGDGEAFDPAWLLALGRPLCLWGANHYASRLPDASGWLVWDKERPDELDQATCELAWTNYIKGVRRFRWLWNGMIRARPEALVHPMQKPVALMTWCLSLRWTPPGLILDPYMGSGPTLEAAKLLGRPAIGIELEPAYCEAAVNRLRQGVLFPSDIRAPPAPRRLPPPREV